MKKAVDLLVTKNLIDDQRHTFTQFIASFLATGKNTVNITRLAEHLLDLTNMFRWELACFRKQSGFFTVLLNYRLLHQCDEYIEAVEDDAKVALKVVKEYNASGFSSTDTRDQLYDILWREA